MFQHLIFLCALLFLTPAMAAETQPGDACTTAGVTRSTGGASETPRFLLCNGSVWLAVEEVNTTGQTSLQIGNDTGSCTTAKRGRLRYNGTTIWEYCNGSAWVAFGAGASGGFLYRH